MTSTDTETTADQLALAEDLGIDVPEDTTHEELADLILAEQWARADGVAEEASHEVFQRMEGARVHQDSIEPSRTLYRLTVDGTTVVWGTDTAHEGDVEPCVTWTVYDADGDDLLAATLHTDSACGGTAEDLAGRVAVRRAVGL